MLVRDVTAGQRRQNPPVGQHVELCKKFVASHGPTRAVARCAASSRICDKPAIICVGRFGRNASPFAPSIDVHGGDSHFVRIEQEPIDVPGGSHVPHFSISERWIVDTAPRLVATHARR